MIKFELETPQPGVAFYGNRQSGTVAVILNIQADTGVKEVRFTGIKGCSPNLKGSADPLGSVLLSLIFNILFNRCL